MVVDVRGMIGGVEAEEMGFYSGIVRTKVFVPSQHLWERELEIMANGKARIYKGAEKSMENDVDMPPLVGYRCHRGFRRDFLCN